MPLHSLGIGVSVWITPVEVQEKIPFALDIRQCAYDRDYAQKFPKVPVPADRVMQIFRSCFIGKCSLVHFLREPARCMKSGVFTSPDSPVMKMLFIPRSCRAAPLIRS